MTNQFKDSHTNTNTNTNTDVNASVSSIHINDGTNTIQLTSQSTSNNTTSPTTFHPTQVDDSKAKIAAEIVNQKYFASKDPVIAGYDAEIDLNEYFE